MSFSYPASDLDNSKLLLSLIGSFWFDLYTGNDLVEEELAAVGRAHAQTHLDLLELVASISRYSVPVFHTENWHFLEFQQSQINRDTELARYRSGSAHRYQPGGLAYGTASQALVGYSIPVPEDLADCRLLVNRLSDPSLVWTAGIDFWRPEPGVLFFRANPFDSPLVPARDLFEDGEVVDRQAGLWLFRGQFDWQHAYEQFGYALKLHLASSEGYRELLNAVLDAITGGTTIRTLQAAWSALTGVPLAGGPETVELVEADSRALNIVTDKAVYQYPLGSTAVVAAGDTVAAGDPLVDTLRFQEFRRGQLPADLSALVLGRGLLAAGYYGDLVFENKLVPLSVTQDADGRTKISFELGGFPGDVEQFFDDVHARGLLAGKTLAQLLDIRPDPQGDPDANSLPALINPLEFLVRNLFRYHVFVVRVKLSSLGPKQLGLAHADVLRKIVPPQTGMLVIFELEFADAPIILEGPGSETAPGYTETVRSFPCMIGSEAIDGSTFVQERVRGYQIRGKCE